MAAASGNAAGATHFRLKKPCPAGALAFLHLPFLDELGHPFGSNADAPTRTITWCTANTFPPSRPILIRSGHEDHNGNGKRPRLAESTGSPRPTTTTAAPGAASPPPASAASCYAASATCAATASAGSNCATSAASNCAASTAATSAAGCELYATELRRSCGFLIENIKRRQTDVENFLFAKGNDGAEVGILVRDICYGHIGRCASSHRQ